MAFIKWDQSYMVNIESIDTQHRILFSLINLLNDDRIQEKRSKIVGDTLDGLVEYMVKHFSLEELLMMKHKYPLYESHKQAHDEFSKHVINFQNEFYAGKQNLDVQIVEFLKEWLTRHIMTVDKILGKFLEEHGEGKS